MAPVAAVNPPSSGKVIVINATPTRPAKRARTVASGTPRRTSACRGTATPRRTSARQNASRRGRNNPTASRGDEEDDDDEASDTSSSDDSLLFTLNNSANTTLGNSFVHQNVFDTYFAAASKPSRTSGNIFSHLVPPLAPDEYTALLRNSNATPTNATELEEVLKGHERLFPRYALELAEGFNLVFFGFGSKRTVLNKFARTVCAKRGHVIVVNGYMPHVGIKEIIASIEQIPGLTDTPLPASSTGLDSQTRRIYDFFLPPVVRPQHSNSEHRLFLIIHNIDSRALRATKAKGALSLLALNPRVHVVASVDHVHAQMVWSTAEAGARKHTHGEGNVNTDMPPTRGFAWAWHDMTTMQPYDAELAHVDLNRNGKKSRGGTVGERGITETAARHILASVNAKAKKLFVLLAKKQLRSLEDSGTESKNKELKHHAVLYDALFNAARTDFIATNDTSFTALLAEFRDHKLIILNAGGGGEGLWIPLKPEELRRVIASLVAE